MTSRTRRHAADDVTQESLDLTTAEETLTMYFMAFGYRHCSNDNKGRRFCAMFKGQMVPSCLMPDNGNRCLLCKWTLYADQMSNTTLQDRILLMAPETAASIRDCGRALWPCRGNATWSMRSTHLRTFNIRKPAPHQSRP